MRRLGAVLLLSGVIALVGPASAEAEPLGAECSSGAGTLIAQPPVALGQLGITSAWRLSQGEGVRVAIVDSGVDAANPHLEQAVDPGIDLVAGGDGSTDTFGHGTAVAAVIAARQVPGSGLVGVAPAARIVPVRVYASDDRDAGPTAARTAAGIEWASQQPGVKVIVVPLTTESDEVVLRDAVNAATARGVLVVAAAGNATGSQAPTVQFPAGYPEALSVTALDLSGQAPVGGVHVEVAAPGQQVLAVAGLSDCVLAADQPSTSYASGYAGGVAALVAAAYPDESPADWQYRLLATALRPNAGERSVTVGWGLLAPYDALNFVNDGGRAGPANPHFPAPVAEAPPGMARPAPTPDHAAEIRLALGALTGGAVASVVGGLLVRRLRVTPGAADSSRASGRC